MNFVFIFAAKLAINNDMSKDFFKELTPVAIRDYYKSLSKKDRAIFFNSSWRIVISGIALSSIDWQGVRNFIDQKSL